MFIISGRRESQIGIGPDSYENIRLVRPNERENISVIQRYTCFCLALGICGLIQHDYRLIYLYVTTVMLWLFAIFRGTCTFSFVTSHHGWARAQHGTQLLAVSQ